MPKCELGECGISCEFGCSCMEWIGGHCECECENVSLFEKPVDGVVDPEAYVNFTATEMPLVRLAAWFEFLFPGQILIPASKAETEVTTDGVVKEIKLGDLIKHVGLATARKPLVGRDFAKYESDT